MAKIIWRAASVVTVLAAGFLLYDGGKLLFGYHDRRQGVITLVSGVAICVLYVWSFHQSFRRTGVGEVRAAEIWSRNKKEMVLTNIAMGAAVSGIILLKIRYFDTIWLICFPGCIILYMFIATYIMLVIKGRKGSLQEKKFQKNLLESKAEWEEKGRIEYDAVSRQLVADVIEGRMNQDKGVCIIFIILSVVTINAVLVNDIFHWAEFFIAVIAGLVGSIRLYSYSRGAQKLADVLNYGGARSVLGFYMQYYELADSRMAGLSSVIQLYAAAALCDLEAYEEALELEKTISRRKANEAYILEFELICLERLRRREELIVSLGRMRVALGYIGGRQKKHILEICEIINHLVNARYTEALQLLERNVVESERQRRLRLRLIEDARNQVFGVENGHYLEGMMEREQGERQNGI